MQEFVFAGGEPEAAAARRRWMAAAPDWMALLGMDGRLEPATDAFFGRSQRLMERSQREQDLKFEWLLPIFDDAPPVAVMSFNLHLDHMGKSFGMTTADGGFAHSACVGFGMDRLAVAVLALHGFDRSRWPTALTKAMERAS